jgi:hypothetical protein
VLGRGGGRPGVANGGGSMASYGGVGGGREG